MVTRKRTATLNHAVQARARSVLATRIGTAVREACGANCGEVRRDRAAAPGRRPISQEASEEGEEAEEAEEGEGEAQAQEEEEEETQDEVVVLVVSVRLRATVEPVWPQHDAIREPAAPRGIREKAVSAVPHIRRPIPAADRRHPRWCCHEDSRTASVLAVS